MINESHNSDCVVIYQDSKKNDLLISCYSGQSEVILFFIR